MAQNKINKDTKQFGDRLPQMYFGAHNGVFRIFPARHSKVCDSYDNRKRPWYVAASSGPKDIIIILDISGSMSRQNRIDLAKDAAKDVISALTIGDHFGVVQFSSDAKTLGGKYLLQATKENKQKMKDYINNIEIGGGTNFYAGFKTAFELLTVSVAQEANSGCNSAMLFLTDGEMTAPLEGFGSTSVDIHNYIEEQL